MSFEENVALYGKRVTGVPVCYTLLLLDVRDVTKPNIHYMGPQRWCWNVKQILLYECQQFIKELVK